MEVICTLSQGKLKGSSIDKAIDGSPILSFLTVPYAKPPLGKLRFKAPQPPEKWEGVRDATQQGGGSLRIECRATENGFIPEKRGSEDCLHLNIFTHQLFQDGQKLRPVMVFIHGGAFVLGSNDRNLYGPEFLLTENVVLVTITYRLGALGFLTLDDPLLEVTGNAGLKDQVQALKWVQENIKEFGGDPNNVTLFGHSAGSACVHLLLLSPLAKGLFQKAIVQSGVSTCPWVYGNNDAKYITEKLGIEETNSTKILEKLQNIPAEDFLQAQQSNCNWIHPFWKRFFCLEIEKKNSNAFLTELPIDLLKSGRYEHVPLMVGYVNCEGMIHHYVPDFEPNFENVLPYYLNIPKGSKKFEEKCKQVCQFYFGKDEIDPEKRDEYFQFFTDTLFLFDINNAVRIHAKTNTQPVYYYRVSAESNLNHTKKLLKIPEKGPCHGDELGYLFKVANEDLNRGSVEEKLMLRFVKMWTNFAKTGNPIPVKDDSLSVNWKPVTPNELNFLDIGTELVPGVDPDKDRVNFWDEINKDIEKVY